MALVLAVGRLYTQKRISEELTRQFSGHEIVTAALTGEAFARIGARVPDLVVFPGSLFPSEQAALAARLREWSDHQPDGPLPIAVSAHSSGSTEEQWFYWFKSNDARQLVHAGTVKAKDDGRAAQPARRPVVAAAPRPVATPTPSPPPVTTAPVVAAAVTTPPVTTPPVTRPPIAAPPVAARPVAAVGGARTVETKDDHEFARTDRVTVDVVHDEAFEPAASRVSELLAAGSTLAGRIGALAAASGARFGTVGRVLALRIGALLLASAKGLGSGSGAMLRGLQQAAGTVWRGAKRVSSTAASQASSIEMPSEEARRRALRIAGIALAATAAIAGIGIVIRQAGSITTAAAIRKPAAEAAVENHPAETPPTNKGRLNVVSEPPGAAVLVDGKQRGVTPILVDDLTIGQHTITLNGEAGSVTQSVKVKANEIATLDLPIFTGWVALFAPFEVQIVDGGRVIDLDEQNRAMLPPGKHDLQLINRTLGYHASQTVVVRPGEVTAASIVPPKASSTITSTPPAELWIDGSHVGDTPIESMGIAIGTREFVFKNAEYGERHVTATVAMKPFRLHVDLTKPES